MRDRRPAAGLSAGISARVIAVVAVAAATLAVVVGGLLPGVLGALLRAAPAYGETAPARVVTVDTSRYPAVSVVLALPSSGGAAAALPASAFSVRPRAETHPVRVSPVGGRAPELVLAVDTATAGNALRAQQAAAAELLLSAPPTVPVGVTGGRTTGQRPSTDRVAAMLAVGALAPDRSTTLGDTLRAGLTSFSADRQVTRALVVFPGDRPTGEVSWEQLRRQATARGVSVYVVRSAAASAGAEQLTELAQSTGGRSLTGTDPDRLPAAVGTIVDDVSQRYTVSFRADGEADSVVVSVRTPGGDASAPVRLPAQGRPGASGFPALVLGPVATAAQALVLLLFVGVLLARESLAEGPGGPAPLRVAASFVPVLGATTALVVAIRVGALLA
jgi:hypothetical protein